MKIMQVSLTIDVNNEKQVDALKQLMDSLKEDGKSYNGPLVSKGLRPSEPEPDPIEEEDEEAIRKARAAERRKARKQKTQDPEPDPIEEEEEDDDDELLGEEEKEEEQEIELSTLRELTAEKSTQFREEIKSKLVKLGAKNVSSIPEDKYREYYNFISKL